MFIVTQYWLAFFLCFITMICWGSWANAQKISSRQLPFQLFYWNYSVGVLALAIVIAFTCGSIGVHGRSFLPDLAQASGKSLTLAFVGGVIFNLANILLVAAIDIAGMAIAFPIAIGLALVLGVIINYVATPIGNVSLLTLGVILILVAILVSASIYRQLPGGKVSSKQGIIISLVSGILMGLFYYFVAASMSMNLLHPDATLMTPYTAMVLFSLGLFLSNFVFNTYMMKKPLVGKPVSYASYWQQKLSEHVVGWLGGIIWGFGTVCSFIASGKAGFAISYGLGQGATMIAAAWGVFVWREFANAPAGTSSKVALMFILYIVGLISLIFARLYA